MTDIDQALSNLDAIKNGDDPRASDEASDEATAVSQTSTRAPSDPLAIANNEVDRLYDEFPELGGHLPRQNLHVAVARWDAKNGNCKYNTKFTTKHRFNKRITKTKAAYGEHAISVNEKIIEDTNRDNFLDTVRHETAHAVLYEKYGESQEHNANWKNMARKLGANPSSCNNKKDTTEMKYVIACPNCKNKSGRRQRSKVIKRPFHRMCNRCHEHGMVSYDSGSEMPTENGTVAVDSLSWNNKREWIKAGRP